MADIKQILNKKSWTGRELGILEVTNMAVLFRQAIAGEEQKPLMEEAKFRKMLSTLTDREQGMIYRGYISIHEWISIRYNIAQTQLQQAQLQHNTLAGYLTDAVLAEDVYGYVGKLPVIMTQKQYDDTKAASIDALFKDEAGGELYSSVFHLIARAVHFYLEQLRNEPSKPNPLKAIRAKYVTEPVKSDYIRSRWNELTDRGYLTIEDGSGRRSDQMSAEEWQDAITTPTMRYVLSEMKAKDGHGVELLQRLADQQVKDRAKVIYAGGTEADAEKAVQQKEYERGLATRVTWHYYEDVPNDLTKWDVLEQVPLAVLYPIDSDGSGNINSDANFTRSTEDLMGEFGELVATMLNDIDSRYPQLERGLSDLPVKEWKSTYYSLRSLYEMDFYGERAFIEADNIIFRDNRRAVNNGIAILRAGNHEDDILRIDKNGYYVEPDIKHALLDYTLEAFFPEAEDYAENIDIVESARQSLIESYYYIQGYNYALDMIGRYYDIFGLDVFRMDTVTIEKKIRAFNDLVKILYAKIRSTDYSNKELQTKKLDVLSTLFREIDYFALFIPEENRAEAEELLEGFKAFMPEHTEHFNALLCNLPQIDGKSEGGGEAN